MDRKIIIDLPEDVRRIIHILERAGHEAYVVGGCVRDMLLGRDPLDWDITTSAKPFQVKGLFRKTVDTGIQHGTVTVLMHQVGYEVTTYRIDGEYEDNRHPRQVEFTGNLILDLQRRDFTINAMAYNDARGLVDEFCGIQDLERHRICCVGDPGKRFDEDALRMLRAVRFSGQLGFMIEEGTRKAIAAQAHNLKNISAERIRAELSKLLVAKDAGKFREAYALGMTDCFLPEFSQMMVTEQKNPHHIYTVGEHAIHSVEVMNFFLGRSSGGWDTSQVPAQARMLAQDLARGLTAKQEVMLCFAMLLHDVAKPDTMTIDGHGIGHFYGHQKVGVQKAGRILKRLKFDNETVSVVKALVQWHDYQYGLTAKAMRRAISKIGRDVMPLLFLVQMSDILAQNPDTFQEKLDRVYCAASLWKEILESDAALQIQDLDITGSDLIAAGMSPGPEIGAALKAALSYVLDNPKCNRKEILLCYLQNRRE